MIELKTEKFLAFVGISIAVELALLGIFRTPLLTVTLSLVALGFLVWPCLHIAEVFTQRKWSDARAQSVLTLLTSVFCVTALAWAMWPHNHRHILAEGEREQFERPLKAQPTPRYDIELACPQADENVCVYAAQFINAFREAGWSVVDNQVHRVTLAIPYDGVRIFEHTDGHPDPNDWRSGAWLMLGPDLKSVREAFLAIGIEPDGGTNPALPVNRLTVYFGPERTNESEPTDLTRAFGQMKAVQPTPVNPTPPNPVIPTSSPGTEPRPNAATVPVKKPTPTSVSESKNPAEAMTPKNRVTIARRLLGFIVEQFQVNGSDVKPDSDFEVDLGGDPLDKIELRMKIEEEYGITIPDADLRRIKTVKQMTDYIERRVCNTEPKNADCP